MSLCVCKGRGGPVFDRCRSNQAWTKTPRTHKKSKSMTCIRFCRFLPVSRETAIATAWIITDELHSSSVNYKEKENLFIMTYCDIMSPQQPTWTMNSKFTLPSTSVDSFPKISCAENDFHIEIVSSFWVIWKNQPWFVVSFSLDNCNPAPLSQLKSLSQHKKAAWGFNKTRDETTSHQH